MSAMNAASRNRQWAPEYCKEKTHFSIRFVFLLPVIVFSCSGGGSSIRGSLLSEDLLVGYFFQANHIDELACLETLVCVCVEIRNPNDQPFKLLTVVKMQDVV